MRNIVPLFIISLMMFSCDKDSAVDSEKESAMRARLQGEWISIEQAEGFYRITFDAKNVSYYMGEEPDKDSKAEQVYSVPYELVGKDYSTLRINLLDGVFKVKANFDHQFSFENDQLRIKNLQKNLTQVVGEYAGDVSEGYHDIVFKRLK